MSSEDALRKAFEEAATEFFGRENSMKDVCKQLSEVIERHVTPVVEALVAAAYKSCAEYIRREKDWESRTQEGVANDMEALTPASAADALTEHDNVLIQKCAESVGTFPLAVNEDNRKLLMERLRRIGPRRFRRFRYQRGG